MPTSMACGASHDTSILLWPRCAPVCVCMCVCSNPPRNWPVSTGRVWLLSPLLTAAQPHSHKCGCSKKVKHDEWRDSLGFFGVSVHWFAANPKLHSPETERVRGDRRFSSSACAVSNVCFIVARRQPFSLELPLCHSVAHSFPFYLWPHKGSLAAHRLKGRSLTGAQQSTGSLWDHMGGMSESVRERVSRASATAVCRYFYQREEGGEEGRKGTWGWKDKMLRKLMRAMWEMQGSGKMGQGGSVRKA